MKKFTILLALVMMVAMPTFAEHVTPETARKVASTFLKNNGAKANQLTDLSKAAGFPNLYIFTADEGFVVMSADDCVTPILGYSLTNKFNVEDMPENKRWWLQGYSDQIQEAIKSHMKASPETAQQWRNLVSGKGGFAKAEMVVEPLTQTSWGQDYPYNNLCPSGTLTGCVATAMAQVMKYWNYPKRGIGSHDYQYSSYGVISVDFGSTNYDWDNMLNSYSGSSTEVQKNAVATLMHHCGVSVEMKYGPSASGSNIERSASSMRTYFNYNASYLEKKDFPDSLWIDTLKYELDHHRPVLYGGSGSGGHAFVCDGYNNDGKFHFNWGWKGSHNDEYFILTSLKPGSNNNFSNNQDAVISIWPLTENVTPLNLSSSQTGQNVTLSWTDGQNSSSYNVYRNNALIATTEETTYSDTAPCYGSNVYYVRGLVDSILTLPSNYASITFDYSMPVINSLSANTSNNNISLSWETPEWCYPPTADEESFSYINEERLNNNDLRCEWPENSYTTLSWGHRYPAENLTNYDGKAIYEVSFFSLYTGAFDIVVYQGTDEGNPVEVVAQKSITTARIGWSRVCFNSPAIIDANKDLWIFVFNTDHKVRTVFCKEGSYNMNGCYFSTNDPTTACYNGFSRDIVWLIHAYLTDGTYTYNLYDNDTKLNGNTPISDTSYLIENCASNTIHRYIVKTNYYNGESTASNMAGLTVGTASINGDLTLDDNDKMTITENSTLTVNGTLTNTNADNLIIEDGGQLITSSDDVAATVKKTITGHGPNDLSGWKFIASPVSTAINPINAGLITDTLGSDISEGQSASYDLYYFDESQDLPWKNYRNESFCLENGKGYLYANNNTIDLAFAGTLYNGNGQVTLTYNDDGPFKGWNLVGNPFICDASIDRPFFIINGRNLKASTGTIPPCTGVMVQAAAVDTVLNTIDYTQIAENVTFTKVNPSSATSLPNQLQITVAQQVVNRDGISTLRQAQGSETIDNAIVSFNKGNLLEKFVFDADLTKLYIPNKGKDFAIVTSEGIGEMPLNFSAAEDGTYTLTVNPEGVDMNYLHLIDNLTGNDVDLLASPDYTFEAKTTDYASRFRLVFASVCEDTDDSNENFAFINDGNIIVYKEGTLQIIDITGRIVLSGDAMNRVSTSRMTPGVYVLRLITANGVKTQKTIID